ncbi:spermatogenesis-associated protein 20 isoform X1 [Pieris brassicae]|uniref:Spermatogenesis-associated protein 20-like TRX domain-containing protein n=1 Tax=Pieris brassicae TaxID=7116 RepID=A0A9P0SQZ9_PIEBR|nr:spermatogenesis-associated protein 20 isoform X1 [Pieris brassicae]CAH3900268.1 unnamed protein product [Pieris brassicae]
MPYNRATSLLRRLSLNDSKLKNFGTTQNNKEIFLPNHICNQRDFCWTIRISTLFNNNLNPPNNLRGLCDNIIKMSAPTTEQTLPDKPKFTNKLGNEKSPYLLQHANNPVNWYPWCQEALDKAKQQNKLIFLSVGYSTCHWCHVMEKESFENEDIAKIMNDNFINIKLDREERPDLDRLYMLFVMATTGSGGWPMSVFLTPELKPIKGGTYYPPEDRFGYPGFKTLLRIMADKWRQNSKTLMDMGDSVIEHIKNATKLDINTSLPGEVTWLRCVEKYMSMYEPEFGGFGTAPKFPHVPAFNFLFHYYARDKYDPKAKECLNMCLHTLTKMAKGGIHDHISSGFARYSTDNHWQVPHFEKMLYDQAQLAVAYTDAYLATKDEFFADVIRDIIKYVNTDLRHEHGGYYSAEDADSYPSFGAQHKQEGAFYVWDYDELKNLLSDKLIADYSYLDIFCHYYNVEEDGNVSPGVGNKGEFDNKNVLIVYGGEEDTMEKFGLTKVQFRKVISTCREILFEVQQKRPRPHLDSKLLCSWNGLMISGLARAGQGLEDKNYVDDAIKTANFIKQNFYCTDSKSLLHSCYKEEDGSITCGEVPIKGFLDDYAFLIRGLLDLYEASLDMEWLKWARDLQQKQNDLFWDSDVGGYYTCSDEDDSVIIRLKEDQDSAEPAGNSVACHNLLRLAVYADRSPAPEGGQKERDMAKKLLLAFSQRLSDTPNALPEMVSALMLYNDSPTQVLISGPRSDPRTLELVRVVRSRLLPGRVLALTDPNEAPAVLSRSRNVDVPRAYVCRRYACSLPVTDVKQLETLLDEPAMLQ